MSSFSETDSATTYEEVLNIGTIESLCEHVLTSPETKLCDSLGKLCVDEAEVESLNSTATSLLLPPLILPLTAPLSQVKEVLPPIRLIDFKLFKLLTAFPRYPENKDLCENIDTVDRKTSFIVFISHCWLRGWSGAPGWDGRPHPDTATADKFKLCVAGIQDLLGSSGMAKGACSCYIWLDFGCMDQDGNPAGELKQLDEIVRNADCIFTPIHSENMNTSTSFKNLFDDYLASAWNEGPYSYIHRGWCRVEMFYAANIPVIEDITRAEVLFQHGLKKKVLESVRPHLLYGTSEFSNGRSPIILPPLQNSYYDKLNPIFGNITVATDRLKIEELYEQLKPHFKIAKEDYIGSYDHEGYKSDNGEYFYPDGAIYKGSWLKDKKHGSGKWIFADGAVYEGEFSVDEMSGFGRFEYADGGIYEGNMKSNVQNGYGYMRFPSGASYKGDWVSNIKSGEGTFVFVNGNIYTGSYVDDKRSGVGTFNFVNGMTFEGIWDDDKMREGKLLLSDNAKPCNTPFKAVFSGGDTVINGTRVYDVVLYDSDGSIKRSGQFSNGIFLD